MLDRLLYRGAPRRLDGRFRTVGDSRMFERSAVLEGAPVLVLVHGVGVSGRYLLPTAGRLAERCSVFVPDLPGFGRSGRTRARPTVPQLADELHEWLTAAQLRRPAAFLANSMGCQIVVDLAARHPDRVERLILVGPTVDWNARSLGRQAARLALDVTREPLPLWALQAFDYSVHVAKRGVASFVEMTRDEIERKLHLVEAPTLVVRGARDPIVPQAWAKEVAARLPNGRFAEIPGAPHAANYTAPDALARLTLDFLAAAET